MFSGKRMKYIRKLRGMTQKEQGMKSGLDERTADIRIAQYESGKRVPKNGFLETLADVLGVIPEVLKVPDIDDSTGIMHTFFALEDLYGFEVLNQKGKVYIFLSDKAQEDFTWLKSGMVAWSNKAEALRNGEISYAEYDEWRYHFKTSEKDISKDPIIGYCRNCGEKITGAGVYCSKCGRMIK